MSSPELLRICWTPGWYYLIKFAILMPVTQIEVDMPRGRSSTGLTASLTGNNTRFRIAQFAQFLAWFVHSFA